MTDTSMVDDDVETASGLWGIIDNLTERGRELITQAKDSEAGYASFTSPEFVRLSANDRNFVLQRVRGKALEQNRHPYRLFWLPGAECFAVAVRYPIDSNDPETDTDLETIPSVYAYIRREITSEGSSFRRGGVLQLRDIVDDGNVDRFKHIAQQLDGQTRDVGDGSNATFTLKWHQAAQQIEVRVNGVLALN